MKETRHTVRYINMAVVLLLSFLMGMQNALAYNESKTIGQEAEQAVSSCAVEDGANDIHDVEIMFCSNRVMLKDKHGDVKKDKHGFIRWGHEVTAGEPIWGVATFHKDKPFKDGRAVQKAYSVKNMLTSNCRLHVAKRVAERIFAGTQEAKQYLAQAVKDSGQSDVVAVFPGSNGSHPYYEGVDAAWKFKKSRFDRHKRVYVVFDYASRGNKPGLITYLHDRRIVGASETDAEGMVTTIAQVVGRDHIIFKDHSMGCLLGVRVAKHFYDIDCGIKMADPTAKIIPFKELDLTYADIDRLTYTKDYAPAMIKIFNLVSSDRSGIDKLMRMSHLVNGKGRAGEKQDIANNDDIPGHIIWDYTKADYGWFGHAIFFEMSEDLEGDGEPVPGWTKVLLRDENGCRHYTLHRCTK